MSVPKRTIKMDFYEKRRKAGIDLLAWINDEKRDKFSELSRRCLFAYGFDLGGMRRLLEKNFPGLTIKDDRLEKVK